MNLYDDDPGELAAHLRDDGLRTCEHCGNMGYFDSWPFVSLRIVSLTDDVDDEMMLCADCAEEWEA